MKGSGPGAGVVGRSRTVLVFEFVTGGGLAGRDLPGSWAAEGSAMRRAIVGDFAAVPGLRVVTTVDPRLPRSAPPGVDVRVMAAGESGLESLASEVDSTLLIAPEADGILARLAVMVERLGGRSLGSSPLAVAMTGDKARLADHFLAGGIPTPPTRSLEPGSVDLPGDWPGPIVIKPRVGAGSVDTVVVRGHRLPPWVPRDRSFVAQPYLPGEPMSASLLVDVEGRSTLLAVGRQRVLVDGDGRISYQGGTIASRPVECPAVVFDAVASVVGHLPGPSLRGFVGVDFLLDDRGRATILEINPRPTTSYVGLARLFPPGTVAGAWLAAMDVGLAGTDWPERLRSERGAWSISFDADGTIRPPPGDPPR